MEEKQCRLCQGLPKNAQVTNYQSSNFTNAYQTFFESSKITQHRQNIELLKLANVEYQVKDGTYFKLRIVNHTSNFEVIRLHVQMGGFGLELIILNSEEKSRIHNLTNISSTITSIYVDSQLIEGTAIKCFELNSEKSFQEMLFVSLKEYIIYKIASILKVGPSLCKIFGFDIIVHNNCIQFCMEKCTPAKTLSQAEILLLKQKLLRLHSLNIVHLDIKPDNIFFSPSLKEIVFIDFGFSDILQQKLGEMTMARFAGSLNYCSPEFLKCYLNGSPGMVDLYYNDVCALQKSILEITQRKNGGSSNQPNSNHEMTEIFYKLFLQYKTWIQIRYHLFISSRKILNCPTYLEFFRSKAKQVLHFCQSLPHTQYLALVYRYLKAQSPDTFKNGMNQNYVSFESDRFHLYQHKKIEVFQSMIEGLHIQKELLVFYKIIPEQSNLRAMLTNEDIVIKLETQYYFSKFVIFTSLQNDLGTFSERQAASEIMMKLFALQQKNSLVSPLTICMKHLLDYFTEKQPLSASKLVPIIFTNLIIMGQLSSQQYILCATKIVSIVFSDQLSTALLLFRSMMALQWMFVMIDVSFQKCKTFYEINKTLINKFALMFANISDFNNKPYLKIVHQIFKVSITFKNVYRETYLNLLNIQSSIFDFELLSQLKKYYFITFIRYHSKKHESSEVYKYINVLMDQEKAFPKKYCKFEVYCLPIISFYFKCINLSMVAALFNSLSKCFGSLQLVQKFSMYSYYRVLFYRSHSNNRNYYIQILKELQNSELMRIRVLVQRLQFIHNPYILKKIMKMFPQQIDEIFKKLRYVFPVSLFNDFGRIHDQCGREITNFCMICSDIVVIMSEIHSKDPALVPLRTKFIAQLKQLLQSQKCCQCKQGAYKDVLTIESYILFKQKDYRQLVRVLREYIHKKTINLQRQKLFYAAEIVRYSVCDPELIEDIDKEIQFFYEWIQANNTWDELIYLPSPEVAIQIIFKYLFINNKSHQFLRIQKLLLANCEYSNNNYLIAYCSCLIQIMILCPAVKLSFRDELYKIKLQQFADNKYSILFFAIVLVWVPLNKFQLMGKIIKLICFQAINLNSFSKWLTIGHFYHYVLRAAIVGSFSFTDPEKIKKELRYIRHTYWKYLKCGISKCSFNHFATKLFTGFKVKNKQAKKSKIQSKLRRYFEKLAIEVSSYGNIVEFNKCPFDEAQFILGLFGSKSS